MTHDLIDPATVLPHYTRSDERATFLADIVTTAVEGGIGYWSTVSDYRWWSPTVDGGTALHKGEQPNAYVIVYPEDADEDKGRLVMVDDISRALGVLREGPVKGLAESLRADIVAQDRANGEDENHQDIDAGLADCIVQVALFGEVVYG